MAYAKQTWAPYDENKSEEENIKSGAVGTAERLNHIEDGIKSTDTDLTAHKNDAVSHVTKSDRDKWDAKLQASNVVNYQKVEITRSDGQALITVSGTNAMIDTFKSKGTGFYTFVTGGSTDAPELPLRGFVDMSRPGIGNVYAISDTGNFYIRAINGNAWKDEWQQLVSKVMFDNLESRVAMLEQK